MQSANPRCISMKNHQSFPPQYLIALTILMGAAGFWGQLIILREQLLIFAGNELIIGVILANWLLFEAGGAISGGFLLQRFKLNYWHLFIGYGLSLPFFVFLARYIVGAFLDPVLSQGLGSVLLLSLFTVSLPSFLHGALFPATVNIYPSPQAGGKVYLFETGGTLLGGLIFTFIAAGKLANIEAAFWVFSIHLICYLCYQFQKKMPPFFKVMSASLIIAVIVLSVTLVPLIIEKSWQVLWPQRHIIDFVDSPYGNIAVQKSKNEFSFIYDNQLLLTLPHPDKAFSEKAINIIAALHENPEQALVLSGGFNSTLQQLSQHPLQQIKYLELDYHLLDLVKKYGDENVQNLFAESRLNILTYDARYFVNRTDEKFDLIIYGDLHPDSLQLNRLFTVEFFNLLSQRLHQEGILALNLKGSAVYMDQTTLQFNAIIYHSLKQVFPYLTVIADHEILMLASFQPLDLAADTIYQRLEDRNIVSQMLSLSYLNHYLHPQRLKMVESQLMQNQAPLNYDFYPQGFLQALMMWSKTHSPTFYNFYHRLNALSLQQLLIVIAVFFLCALKFFKSTKRLLYTTISTGFCGLAFDILILLIFQSIYGYVYQMAGLIMAFFMLGIFLGAALSLKSKKPFQKLLQLDLQLIILTLSLYPFALLLSNYYGQWPQQLLIAIFILFALSSGFALGGQFPLLLKLYQTTKKSATGLIYGLDLLGGYLGGILISLILFPLLGLWQTIVFLAVLKTCSFFLLLSAREAF